MAEVCTPTAVGIVEDWLRSVDLVQYTQAFVDNGYDDLEVCKQIGDDDLEAIGVKEEHREKLIRAVKILREEGGTAVYFTLEECDTCQSDNETEVGDCHEDESSAVDASTNKFTPGKQNVGLSSSNAKVFSAQYRGNTVDISKRQHLATFSRMQLQLILRDKLVLGNIDLSSPPYTNMDQTICGSSLTALAIRFSQDLNTHFAHVIEQLEELWILANNSQNNFTAMYPSPARSLYSRSHSVQYEPIHFHGDPRMHPPPLPSCPPPSTMSSSHHPGRLPNLQGQLRADGLSQPTYVTLDGDASGNVIEEKKKGSGSVFGRFLRNFGLRRSARKAAYKQHQGDLNASEMSMSEEDRMALMLLVKEGKISTQDALAVVQRYEEDRKHSGGVGSSPSGLDGHGKENDTPSKKLGTGKKKKGSKPPKSQSSFSADDPQQGTGQGPPYNISSPQNPCEHMVCRRVHSMGQLDSGHHPSSPRLDASQDLLNRDKLVLTRAVSCSPACTPVQKFSSQSSDAAMSRLQSPHHHNVLSPTAHHYYPHPHPQPHQHQHHGLFHHAIQPLQPPPPQHHLYHPHQNQQQYHHRHLNKVDAIRERLTGKNINGVSKTSSKTSLLSSGSDQSMDYGSSHLPLRTDLLNRRGTNDTGTYHSNSTVSMSSDNSPAPGRKKSTGLPPDPKLKNHRSASCSTGDDGISSENDDPEQRSKTRNKIEGNGDKINQENRKPCQVKEAHIYRPPLLRQLSAPVGPSPHSDRYLGQAMAVVDFIPGPEDDGFVPLKRGDVVNIMNMAQSGVWRGVVNGKLGKFRFEHVEVIINPGNQGSFPPHTAVVNHHKNPLSPTPTPGQMDIPRSVAELLSKIGLDALTNLFVMNGYDDVDIFSDLDEADLDALHIQDMDHRKRLLSAAKVLRDWNEKQSRSQTPSIKAVDSPSSRAGNSSCDSGCYAGGDGHKHRQKGDGKKGDKDKSKGPRTPCNSCGKPKHNMSTTKPSPSMGPTSPHHPFYGPGFYGTAPGLSYNPYSTGLQTPNHLFSSSTLYATNAYPRSSDPPSSSSTGSMTTSATLTEMNMNITESVFVPPSHSHTGYESSHYRDPRYNAPSDIISLTEEDQEVIAITYGTHRRRKPSSASAQAVPSSSSQFEMSGGDLGNHYIPSSSSSIYRSYDPYSYLCSDPNCAQCVAYMSCSQCAAAYHHYVNTTIRSDSKSSKMSYSSSCTQTTCLSPDQDDGNHSGGGNVVAELTTSPNRLNYQQPQSYYHPYQLHQHYTHPSPLSPACADCVSPATPNKFSSAQVPTDISPSQAYIQPQQQQQHKQAQMQQNVPSQKPPTPQQPQGAKSPSLSLTLQENSSKNVSLALKPESTEAVQPQAATTPWPNQSSRQESEGIANLYNTRGRNPSPSKADASVNAQVKSPLRSLMPLVSTKLNAERIELAEEPYSSQNGECAIPPLLVQRYSEELHQDLKTIAQVLEKIREKELKEKSTPFVKNDNLSDSCTSAVELQISSVKDFMFSIGLPMYNSALAEAKISTMEQLIQTKGQELEKITGADSRHLQRISHALEWVQAKLNSPTHRAKTKGPVDKV